MRLASKTVQQRARLLLGLLLSFAIALKESMTTLSLDPRPNCRRSMTYSSIMKRQPIDPELDREQVFDMRIAQTAVGTISLSTLFVQNRSVSELCYIIGKCRVDYRESVDH